MKEKRVIIQVVGGVFQSVKIPKGIVIEVRDYDIDGADTTGPEKFKVDRNGDTYSWYEERG